MKRITSLSLLASLPAAALGLTPGCGGETGDVPPSTSATTGSGGSGSTSAGVTSTTTGAGGVPMPMCGDGTVNAGEECDDGATTAGDGCDASCNVESGYDCIGAPSQCASSCGDGTVASDEQCDDGGVLPDDGCSDSCTSETGFSCTGSPSVCAAICGDTMIVGDEECDVGPPVADDGCSDSCKTEPGFVCDASDCDPVLYAATNHNFEVSPRELYTVDVTDGTTTLIGTMAAHLTGLAFDASGTLWGVGTGSAQHLVTIDRSTAAFALVAQLNDGAEGFASVIPDITFQGGTLFGANKGVRVLYSINTSSGLTSSVGADQLSNVQPIGYGIATAADGTVVITDATNVLFSVNTATGALTPGATLQASCGSTAAERAMMAMTFRDDVLYGAAKKNVSGKIFSIDTGSGECTEVATLTNVDALASDLP